MTNDGHSRDPSGAGKAGVKPGGRGRVTLQIIADRLEVSTATVSLALRESPLVADGTRLRVQQIAREMGYSYNRSAASLRTDRTNILGVGVRNYSGYSNVLVRDSQTPGDPGYLQSSQFGRPVTTAGGVFGSGGARAFQFAARVTF